MTTERLMYVCLQRQCFNDRFLCGKHCEIMTIMIVKVETDVDLLTRQHKRETCDRGPS